MSILNLYLCLKPGDLVLKLESLIPSMSEVVINF